MWRGAQTQRGALLILEVAMQLAPVVVQSKSANVNPALTWQPISFASTQEVGK
jgi:hypothetical protein